MLLLPTLSTKPETDPGLDQGQLFALGMDYVRAYSRQLWTDHNTHDPGITALELVCYALTDLTYRAGFPLEDLLAADDGGQGMAAQFYTARQVLPNRALTALDFRKLLLDIPGIQNAWVAPEPLTYYADLGAAALRPDDPKMPGIRSVDVRGLYRARVAFEDDVTETAARDAVRASALDALRNNRNLCEDFVAVDAVADQWFALCAEIDLAPGATAAGVAAQVMFDVGQYLAPRVRRYSLDEMLAMTEADGNPYTPDAVFNGPTPDHGFVDTAELLAAELRTEIRLSDVIAVVMNVAGVRAVRDLVVNALKAIAPAPGPAPPGDALGLVPVEPADKWRVPVDPGCRPRLSRANGRLVLYKGDMPVRPDAAAVDAELQALDDAVQQAARSTAGVDLPIPRGRTRALASYRSVQNEFPAVYGLSADGLPSNADQARRAAALQFQGYLLFFDQVMANFCAQLANLRTLFTRDDATGPTYASQPVTTFRDYASVYPDAASDAELADKLAPLFESQDDALRRRDRFLDHLLARVASDFHEYVGVMAAAFGGSVAGSVATKSAFLRGFPDQAAERGQGYDVLGSGSDALNVSGVERRLASLLGLDGGESLALVENLLLRPSPHDPAHPENDEPFLPICVDPNCPGCGDDDPYSYQVQVVLPAEAGRFTNMDFRRFVEGVVRREMPAHVMPKVCWADAAHWTVFDDAFATWRALPPDATAADHKAAVAALLAALQAIKNVYPEQKLYGCDADTATPPFVLGRTALGSDKTLNA